ncbi:MAG: type III polyketide synthase [Planctomycetaceae bacterium]
MNNLEILGLGTALPEHSISQAGMATFAATCVAPELTGSKNPSGLIQALYRRAGVQSRHSVLLESSSDDEATAERFFEFVKGPEDRGPGTAERMHRFENEAPKIAMKATAKAIQEAKIDPAEITHLITVSCSGFSAPGVDLYLIENLGLARTVARTHVGFMGCHGALNGLRVAHSFAAADPNAVVAMCAVELCTLHHQYGWDPQQIVANSLFADGAATVIGRATSRSDGRSQKLPGRLVDNYSFVIPETSELMTWKIGDNGFEMTLSPEVPGVITRTLPGALNEFLGRNGLTPSAVKSWAVHPGGPRILAATVEAAGLSDEQIDASISVFQRCGNMSSPTVLFILDELRARNADLPCVMLGFGPGLNVEIALLQ